MTEYPSNNNAEVRYSTEPIPKSNQSGDAGPRINDQRARYVVIDSLDAGKSPDEIREKLNAYGFSNLDANRIIENVMAEQQRTREYNKIVRGGGNLNMWMGGIICLLGTVMTVGSFMAASEGGGRYIIAWGAILFGGIQFFRGLSQRSQ